MPRRAKDLTALEVSRLTAPGFHSVGTVPGLQLQVSPTGYRSWVLRYAIGKTRKAMGLGSYPGVTLAMVLVKAREARQKLEAGIDPLGERLAAKSSLAAAVVSTMSFQKASELYITAHESGWSNAKHAAQWSATLTTYAFPVIGSLSVADVQTAHVISILEPIWRSKTETASRVRGRIESVLDWCTVRGYRQGENPARWRNHLEHLLPARGAVQKVVHHAALPFQEVGAFLAELRKHEGMGSRCLEFGILTATRSGEVRGATWAEIDLESATWVIPAQRMKAKIEHRVPLSSTALGLLAGLPKIMGTDLIFPSVRNTQLSDATMTAVLKRMGLDVTVHGFRSSFRDWAGEVSNYPRETIEHCLAHQLADKAEASYARGSHFEKRRRLMEEWSRFCSAPMKPASVVPIRSHAA
ncbi:MAG: integrase arm-type DNA-binding domain-containing protein [Candidatus Accumulibacter sp. UW25]|jgi:integrase